VCEFKQRDAVAGLAHHLEVVEGIEQAAQARSHQLVVVGDQDTCSSGHAVDIMVGIRLVVVTITHPIAPEARSVRRGRAQ